MPLKFLDTVAKWTHYRALNSPASGRQRINIHGAIDLETGQTQMIEALTIDAASTIRLLESIEALYPMLVLIHDGVDGLSSTAS